MGIILVPVSARSSVKAASRDKVYYAGDGVVRIPKEGTVMIVALLHLSCLFSRSRGASLSIPLLFLLALLALVVFLGGERRGTVY